MLVEVFWSYIWILYVYINIHCLINVIGINLNERQMTSKGPLAHWLHLIVMLFYCCLYSKLHLIFISEIVVLYTLILYERIFLSYFIFMPHT